MTQLSGVPRRANQVKKLAAEVAAKQVARVLRRQAVSDKIGYAIAVTVGAVAGWSAWWAGLVVIAFYSMSAVRAYRQFRKAA
jgi:hypothetical protein